jgi:hypothetical protein
MLTNFPVPQLDADSMIFQQGWAQSHYHWDFMQFLNQTFLQQ